MKDKVTRQCPQTATFEEKGEPKRNRAEALLSLHTQKKKAESSNALITARPKRLKAKAEECSPPQPTGSAVTTLQPLLVALST